jgi:CRP-like cAMP-binding protein
MQITDRVFTLHNIFPFSLLKPEELLIIASAVTEVQFSPGQVVCAEGGMLRRLYVAVEGGLIGKDDCPMQQIVGTTILLTGQPAPFAIRVGPRGCRALTLPRGKFFTIVNKCPTLLVGLFRMPLLGVDYASKDHPPAS